MSLLYSILKPVVRWAVKGSSLHREESYEEFKQTSYDVQKKFKFTLPVISGFEFRDEQLDGFHIIVGKETGTNPGKAVVYFPGGGSRRWQLPYKSSMKHYIRETGAELWIPLYPLLPDHDLMEETEFTIRVHEKMLEKFRPENIVWLGFSGGADVLFQAGRHMVQKHPDLPMPGMMIPVSCSGLLVSDGAKARMKEIDPCDPLLHWDMFEKMIRYYDPDGDLPQYILGKADVDDYTGFPKVIMYFAGDEVFAGIAPDYEKSFIRCG
ncbi:MAG: alpha/beta hydrolase [Solobacterium sp.]|nr:alpha/beta hydrolase [Solobacterium sp.]